MDIENPNLNFHIRPISFEGVEYEEVLENGFYLSTEQDHRRVADDLKSEYFLLFKKSARQFLLLEPAQHYDLAQNKREYIDNYIVEGRDFKPTEGGPNPHAPNFSEAVANMNNKVGQVTQRLTLLKFPPNVKLMLHDLQKQKHTDDLAIGDMIEINTWHKDIMYAHPRPHKETLAVFKLVTYRPKYVVEEEEQFSQAALRSGRAASSLRQSDVDRVTQALTANHPGIVSARGRRIPPRHIPGSGGGGPPPGPGGGR